MKPPAYKQRRTAIEEPPWNGQYRTTVKPQWLEHLWDYRNLFEIRVVRAMRVNQSARLGGKW